MTWQDFIVTPEEAIGRLIMFSFGIILGVILTATYKNQRLHRLKMRYRKYVVKTEKELMKLRGRAHETDLPVRA